jgi:hypothetical protein
MLLNATILIEKQADSLADIVDDKAKQQIIVKHSDKRIACFSYALNPLTFFIRNNLRKCKFLYYTGGGSETDMPTVLVHLRCYITHYLVPKHQWAENIYQKINVVRAKIRKHLIN